MARRYWLFKTDPDTFALADLERSPGRTTTWDGVRNYQARNWLRDEVKTGDGVLLYHSQTDKAVMGTAEVVRDGYPDPTQFDRRREGYDPDSDPSEPRWYAVDIRLGRVFRKPLGLAAMRETPGLETIFLLRKGTRLSVQPVTAEEWKIVDRLTR